MAVHVNEARGSDKAFRADAFFRDGFAQAADGGDLIPMIPLPLAQ
jgi:hypothetical protein